MTQLVIFLRERETNNAYESIYFLEPLLLKIGNEYNLNNVKEISVTNDFLTLDKTITNCQNEESLQDCKTRKYIDTMVEQCKCLSFGIRNNDEVSHHKNKITLNTQMIVGPLYYSRPTQMCTKFKI